MKPLFIIAFLDGRPGHEKQTRGVLNALSNLTPIDVQYRTILPPSFESNLKSWCSYIGSYIIRRKRKQNHHVDIIIGTGSYTHIPMLLLKKDCGGKVVTCMSPDFLLIDKMDLCFVPGHDRVKSYDNVFFTSGPPSTAVFTNRHDKDRGLILVGGIDRKSHHWDSAATISRIGSILEKTTLKNWTISSSPRTPEDMILLLQELAEQHSHVDFIRSEETPEGWIEDAYAQNHFVWVTADSISMIYEALTAGCEVGILPVQWKKRNRKFRRAEKNLLENRLVRSYEKWLAGEERVTGTLHLDEATRCAEEILRRWFPDRLR